MPNRATAFRTNSAEFPDELNSIFARLDELWSYFEPGARMGDPESGRILLSVIREQIALIAVRNPDKIEQGTLDFLRERRRSRLSGDPVQS